MRSRELEPNELQCHTRENTVTVQFCSALQNWPLPLYQVLYQLVELLDPIEVFNFATGLWYFLRAPHKVLIQNEHTLPINDYIIMRYWPSVRSRLLGIMSFIFCAFYAHFRWCTIDVRVKRGCQEPISKWSTEMHYTSLWHSFGSVFVQQS